MKKRITCLILILILLLPLPLTSCRKKSPEVMTQEQTAFNDYLDEVFRELAGSNTLTLNYTLLDPSLYQIEKSTPTLGEFTIEEMKKSYHTEKNYLTQLTKYDYQSLTEDQKLCYDLIKENFLLNCKYADYILYYEALGPTTGLQAQLPILLAEYNFSSKDNIEDYLLLLKDVNRYFNQICEFEQIKSRAGLFMSDQVAQEIVKQCAAFIDHPESNYLIEYFNEKIDQFAPLSEEERICYKKKNQEYVLNYVIPAYESLIYTLNNLMGTGTNDRGLAQYEHGKAYYEYLVQSETGSSRPINEISSMLEQTLSDVLLDMASYVQTDKDLMNKLDNYRFVKTEPEDILAYLKKAILKDFPKLINVNCSIKYVHKSLQDYVSPAMYLVPQIDNYHENSIYINDNPDYDMSELFTTIAHEGYPGHLYQNVYFRSKDIHPVRNSLSCLGYEEGWATYAEMYSYSIAGLDPSVAAILKDNMVATHCIYSRADIGIHYDGWTYAEAFNYLSKYVSAASAEIIYKTLLEEPALYLPYSVGYLEIQQLRKKAQEKLGKKFNLKQFHTFLLDIGPVTFDLLDNQMDRWIESQ